MQEKTSDVPSLSHYAVTCNGKVWSKLRKKWLAQRQDDFGRFDVSLQIGGKAKRFLVHRLVLEAFIGPCPEGMIACHNDGNPGNNAIENLRWDTPQSNAQDAVKHGTCSLLGNTVPRPKGAKHHKAKLNDFDVRWIRYLRRAGVKLRDLAEAFNVTEALVSMICLRKIWRHV